MELSLLTTRVLFPLYFLFLGNYVEAREYKIKADRMCKFRKGTTIQQNILKVIQLGNGPTDFVALCTKKCDKNESCKGFQVFGRECSLVRNDVKGFQTPGDNNNNNKNNKNKRRLGEPKDQNEEDREKKNNDKEKKNNDKEDKNTDKEDTSKSDKDLNPNDKNRSGNRTYTCGKLMTTAPPTVSPSVSSSPTELHSKVFEFIEDTRCKVSKGEKKKQHVHENFSRKECDNTCGHVKKCKSYSWNSKTSECIIFHFRVKGLRKNKDDSVCARIPKKTKATASPTEKLKCIISAELKFPFDMEHAPYYGAHADWLEVTKKDYKNNFLCSSYYAHINDLPGWCKYKNIDKNGNEGNGDSAFVENFEDQYYESYYLEEHEMLDSERVKIKDAHDHVTIIKSFHWLFDEDYYPGDERWRDHMMVPRLTIRNLSNDKQDVIGKTRQHPAKINVSTHIKENGSWEGNPKYKGNISVEIHCDKFCHCEQKEYEESGGFEEM